MIKPINFFTVQAAVLLWLLGFLATGLKAQGFERAVPIGVEHTPWRSVENVRRIGDSTLLIGLRYTSVNSSWRYKVLYNIESGAFGPKMFVQGRGLNMAFGGSYNSLIEWPGQRYIDVRMDTVQRPHLYLSDLKRAFSIDTILDHKLGSWNFSGYQNKQYGLLANCPNQDCASAHFQADSLFLVELEDLNTELGIRYLDTFLLPFTINRPGIFIYHQDNRLEFFNEESRMVFKRNHSLADSVYPYQSGFYIKHRGSAGVTTFLDGEYKLVKDTLGATECLIRRDRFGNTHIHAKYTEPEKNREIVLRKVDWHANDFEQAGIVNLCYYDYRSATYWAFRMSGSEILAETPFRTKHRLFWPYSILSNMDGSFIIGGRVYNKSASSDESYAHFIKVDPYGRTTELLQEQSFSLSFSSRFNSLKVFYDGKSETLQLKLLNSQGQLIQECDFFKYDLVYLTTESRGVYVVQLWDEQGRFLGQQRIVKGRKL